MTESSFLLVSLDEKKSKKLAEVISNDTCRKLLEALSKKEATETELSKDLQLPLSTVHYNLKNLVEANLVVADEYHYSTRGKEILHYKLANKLIIIAPKGQAVAFGDILKKYLPISAVIIAAGIVIDLLEKSGGFAASMKTASFAAAPAADRMFAASVNQVGAAPIAVPLASAQPSIAGWFVLGAFAALFVMFIVDFLSSRSR